MKIAILSDTHFGDPACALVSGDLQNGYRTEPKYEELKSALGEQVDYLVMLGDIFDFSIASYAEAYEAAKAFFTRVANEGLAKEIVYVPGNHDFQFWMMVEHEVNVTRPIENGEHIRRFSWSVPGIFDFRKGCKNPGFNLPDVKARSAGGTRFGGLFLDHLTSKQIPFNVAYPNLYLANNDETILLTHGHYFEAFWAAAGEIVPRTAGKDLEIEGEKPNLRELVALNMPLNQLACTGVGQAGPLTKLVRQIQRDIKDKRFDRIETYLDRLDDRVLDEHFDYWKIDPREWLTDIVINKGIKYIKKELKNINDTRYEKEFVEKEAVRERFNNYFLASVKELGRLNLSRGYSEPTKLPNIQNVIFAHTHVPIAWDDNRLNNKIETLPGKPTVVLHNTGGWLYRENDQGKQQFVGAEMFFCHDGQMSSVRIA